MQLAIPLLRSLVVVASIVSSVTAQWQITELSTHEMTDTSAVKFNSTVDFSITRPGKTLTLCSTQWVHSPTPVIPKSWIQCSNDPLLRFRIAVFNDVSNYTLEVVQVDPVKSYVHFPLRFSPSWTLSVLLLKSDSLTLLPGDAKPLQSESLVQTSAFRQTPAFNVRAKALMEELNALSQTHP